MVKGVVTTPVETIHFTKLYTLIHSLNSIQSNSYVILNFMLYLT